MRVIGMPSPIGIAVVEKHDAINGDIIRAIHKNFSRAVAETKAIAWQFAGKTPLETCYNVWHFLRNEIKYRKDDPNHQAIRLPARLISDGFADCKSYSLFTAAILYNLGLPVYFRYATYRNNEVPTHVYCVVKSFSVPMIIIDGVYKKFNKEVKFRTKKDYQCKY